MNRGKGYPYREKKKPKIKVKEDRRPHLGRWSYAQRWQIGTWEPYKTQVVRDERNFRIPDIRRVQNWTRQDAHTLIDMWAEVSWGLRSYRHKQMSRLAGFFCRLYQKQKGKCAITGIDLHGAPGCRSHGIGVDIINYKLGVRKGNIRLVSAPIAVTRLWHSEHRDQRVSTLNPADYVEWPVFWAVLKHIQWYYLDSRPFKWLPVEITFPTPTLTNQADRALPQPWIEFNWLVQTPNDQTREAWNQANMDSDKQRFCSVMIQDDCLYVSVLKETVSPYSTYRAQQAMPDRVCNADYCLRLCDPNVRFEYETARLAKIGFEALGRYLVNLCKE